MPTFLAGLLVLVGLALCRPHWGPDPSALEERNLEAARRLLVQPECTIDQMRDLLESAFANEASAPERAAEAHLLLGTAYLRQVNVDLPGLGETPTLCSQAAEALALAREHLDKAQELGVPETDQAKLRYRLGKVGFLSNEDPARVIESLAGSVDEGAADNLAEGYALLTHAFLRLQPPNLTAALEANKKQMDLTPLNEELLAPARLLRGELLLRTQDPAGAREVLKFLKPPASPELIAQARHLQARTYQDEREWTQAIKLWQEVLALRVEGSPEAGQVLYNLGVCYRRTNQADEAVKAWDKTLKSGPPHEAAAAALGIAELRLHDGNPQASQAALEAFRVAVRDVRSHEEWNNPFWDLQKTRELFECGCQTFHVLGRYELSMQLAEVYQKLAPPGMTLNLVAQAAEAAGKAKLEQARQARQRETAKPLEEAARDLFRLAAAKHEAAAEVVAGAEQGDRLWQAAECHLYAQNYPEAARLLGRLAKQGPPADRAAQVWFLLAEAERALNHDEAAVTAYAESTTHRGPFAYRARYQLAVLELAKGEVDKAAEQLERNLRDLRVDPDPDAYQKSVFELAGLLFRRGSQKADAYARAQPLLDEALRNFPNAPEAIHARYQLGECYRHMARQQLDNQKREKTSPELLGHYRRQYSDLLKLAATTHEDLLKILKVRSALGPLSEEEAGLQWRATLAAAECRTDDGEYDKPITSYEEMARQYAGKVEALYALAGVARCYYLQMRPEKARDVLERMRAAVDAMNETAFPQGPDMMSKAEWQKWVSDKLRPEARRP